MYTNYKFKQIKFNNLKVQQIKNSKIQTKIKKILKFQLTPEPCSSG